MKALCILLLISMCSCTAGPMIRENALVQNGVVVGTSTTILMGGTFAAKRKGTVTQVKKTGKGGWTVAYMTDSESSENVPLAAAAAWGAAAQAKEAASVDRAKEATARSNGVQETIRHGKTVDGQVALGTEAIKAGSPATIAPIGTP